MKLEIGLYCEPRQEECDRFNAKEDLQKGKFQRQGEKYRERSCKEFQRQRHLGETAATEGERDKETVIERKIGDRIKGFH